MHRQKMKYAAVCGDVSPSLFCVTVTLIESFVGKRSNVVRRQKTAGPVILVAGTRPEAIKLASLYKKLKENKIPVLFCAMGQHGALLKDALRCLDIQPDVSYCMMKPGQDLFHVTQRTLLLAKKLFRKRKPSLVIVQGDTTTAMASALAAFYLKIPVAHVEAGLRSGSMQGPYPEELNRRLITLLAEYHFSPTKGAVRQLQKEGIEKERIFCTGNTVVDALFSLRRKIEQGEVAISKQLLAAMVEQKMHGRKVMLLTAHRRESFGEGLEAIFRAVGRALRENPALFVLFPVHPNPSIQVAIENTGLRFIPNLLLLEPLSYSDLVFALDRSDFVVTDSGGIQEEAASLHKPVLLLRKETDRPEARCQLVGVDEEKILREIRKLMTVSDDKQDQCLPFGDGTAGEQIALIIQDLLENALC